MMKILSAATCLSAISLGLGLGCASTDGRRSEWQTRIEQIHVGMKRGDVERILPPCCWSPHHSIFSGGAQGVTYWVDPHWKVSILYDYTGIPRDSSGQALSHESAENKVLTVPTLLRQDMPKPLKDVKIERRVIEPSAAPLPRDPQPGHSEEER